MKDRTNLPNQDKKNVSTFEKNKRNTSTQIPAANEKTHTSELRYHKSLCILSFLLLAGMGIWMFTQKPQTYSDSERRVLADLPEFTMESYWNGSFMKEFETGTLDQFPLRDIFRRVKAVTELTIFQKKDSNGYYIVDGYLSKVEYPYNEAMVRRAGDRIHAVYDEYLKGTKIRPYLVVVPDKNCQLSKEGDVLELDYERLYQQVQEQNPELEYIEIRDLLTKEDYYHTDTHWRQECILDVAQKIGNEMGVNLQQEYESVQLEQPFYGVYAGQSALPVKADVLNYLSSQQLEHCRVTNYNTGEAVEASVYDWNKAAGRDPYELFLEGATPVITIENNMADSDRELVIFRDSFGSSIAPLFVEGYRKITLVDLRYISKNMVGEYVQFDSQDVLFLYSTLLINQGLGGGNYE